MAGEPVRARGQPVTAVPGDRLARIGDLLRACPPPDIAGGFDQCPHGTWPCVITQAVWLAQGRDRDQEVAAAGQAAARQAEPGQAGWDATEDLPAAERDERLPCWEADAEPGTG
jgi:hypothetical protein